MTPPRWTKFVWSAGNAWLGFAHRYGLEETGRAEKTRVFFIAWGRVGVAMAILATTGWLATATAAWAYLVRARGYADVAWADVAFPWQWDDRREKQGRALLATVDDHFAAGRYREGLFHLRTGLHLVPGDLGARRKLAGIYLQIGRPDLARRTLVDGFPFSRHDVAYAGLAFEASFETEDFEELLALAEAWLATYDRDPAGDPAAHEARARALAYLGDITAASAALSAAGQLETPAGSALLVQACWSAGRRAEALDAVQTAVARHPGDDGLLRLQAHFADQLGRPVLAESALRARELADPTDHRPAVDLLAWLAGRGDEAAFQRELARVLPRALVSEPALADLARLFARTGRVGEIDRLLEQHTPSEAAAPVFALARIDALLVARRVPEAREALTAWRTRWDGSHPHHAIDLEIAEALAGAATGAPDGAGAIERILESNQLGPRGLLTVARRFSAMGLHEPAARVVLAAREQDPADPAILRAAATLALDAGDWDRFTETAELLLARRRPDLAAIDELAVRLSSDRLLFAPGRDVLLSRLEGKLRARDN